MPVGFCRLRIAGFKSFAEPVIVEIRPGLTGIVGPNGCGKSNVVEALRWAMGENNARELRGGEMDDVIFAGTAHRPARNLGEVTLTLESSPDSLFPAPYQDEAEIEISRRIERGAGSAFRLGGRPARARDVQTLFADLSSGARASAMVSQGRVGALVAAKPEDRRAILEEAAGIGGLHARRHEAELKLRAAETNLERAETLRVQLETDLAGLQKQARQATRYRNLSSLVRTAEAELLAIQRARIAAARDAAAVAVREAERAVEVAEEDARRAAEQAAAEAAGLPPLRAAASEQRTALERCRIAREQIEAEQTRAEAALRAAGETLRQLERDGEHATQLRRDATDAEQRLAAEAGELARLAAEHPALQQEAGRRQDEAERAIRAADGALQVATERAADLAAQHAALAAAEGQAGQRLARLAQLLATLDRDRAAIRPIEPAALAASEAGLAEAEADLARARQRYAEAERGRELAQAAHAGAREGVHRAEAPRARLAGEHGALSELLASGPAAGARMIDSLVVPEGLEAAIGAALAEDLQATMAVGDPRFWRVLAPFEGAPLLPEEATCLARLIEAPAALGRALGQIGLVDSARGAALQAGLQPGQVLVARDGASWRWDGFTQQAGAPSPAAVRLQQRNRLGEAARQLGLAERACAGARAACAAAGAAEGQAQEAEQAARVAAREAERRADEARQAHAALNRRAETEGARAGALESQRAAVQADHAEAAAAAAAAAMARGGLADPEAARVDQQVARAALAEARGREHEARAAALSLARRRAEREERLAAVAAERAGWAGRGADAAARAAELSGRGRAARELQALLGAAPARLAQAGAEAAVLLAAAESGERRAAERLAAAELEAAGAERAGRTAAAAWAGAREQAVRAEAAGSQAAHEWGSLAARIHERFGAEPDWPEVADCGGEAEEKARRKLDRLSREREEMGPVNLRADLEAGALAARIGGIERERAEIATAIAKLRGSIGHLNHEGRTRLAAVFAQVDRNFQQLFARMFGGGRAHLALLGSDDPLIAGLEIYAQPPGKKLSCLSLLSGGEQALTALCLIFAVFRCNPAPVCVLDEVDAPLDDANIERFCALLDDMVRETGTRFLVVTHHHLTMARMDRLYGVTMQERGVSRLLSVDLARAAALVEQMAAE